jgi:undecaprenyl-phosphate 4-deoxy-4-formamido-L-arabinose transferase
MEEKKRLISFVIPCYGSEKTISFVTGEIREKLAERPEYDYEIIAVNDCSPDRVWDVLLGLAEADSRIRLIGLAKNMNRPGAVMAGLGMAAGNYVVVMDDDGQCPMDRFWDLMAPVEGEYDVSMAGYPSRKQSAFKDFGTFVNKKMTEYMLDRPKDLEFTNFMVMRRYVAEELCKYRNPYPYMTGLILRTTRRVISVPMEERERYSGNSGFTFKKMVSLWMNGLTAFSIKPLRLASLLGFVTAAVGFIYALIVVFRKIAFPAIAAGYSSLMAVLLLVGGVLMLLLGVIGEYVGRIYISLNNSPQYVIRDLVNFPPKEREKQ